MDTKDFTKELAGRKGISEETAYRYINSVMDTIRQILTEGEEIKIGIFMDSGFVHICGKRPSQAGDRVCAL